MLNTEQSQAPLPSSPGLLEDLSQLHGPDKEGRGGAVVELKLNTHMNLLNPDCVKGWRSGSRVVRG